MEQNQENPRNKAELLERIHCLRAALEELVGSLTESQLTRPGPDGGWSVKDHLAHLATWEEMLSVMLQGGPFYEVFGVSREEYEVIDLDGLNAVIDRRNKPKSSGEVLDAFRTSHQHALSALEKLTDAELLETITYFQPDNPDERPILPKIIGDTCGHYEEHLAWIEEILAAQNSQSS